MATTPEDRDGDYSVGCRAAPEWPGRSVELHNQFADEGATPESLDLFGWEAGCKVWQAHTNPIKRPAATIPTHNSIETKPETFAFKGKSAPSSQFATSR